MGSLWVFSNRTHCQSWFCTLNRFFFPLSFVFSKSSRVLFICVGWSFSLIFKALRSECDDLLDSVHLRADIIRSRLNDWKRKNALFGDLMDHLNRCFGPVLFIYVSTTFVKIAVTTFTLSSYMKIGYNSQLGFIYLGMFIEILYFVLTVYVPSKIRAEVKLSLSLKILTLSRLKHLFIWF